MMPARKKKAAALLLLLQALTPRGAGALDGGEEDPCECLPWKQVYQYNMVMCGEGLEYYHLYNYRGEPNRMGSTKLQLSWAAHWAGDDFWRCDAFFKKLDSNRCVNIGPFPRGTKDWWGGSWCYVQKGCKELNGGARLADMELSWQEWLMSFVNDASVSKVSDLSVKLCSPGRDPLLRELQPEEFFKMAEVQSLNLGYGIKAAWSSTWTFLWQDLMAVWGNSSEASAWARVPEILQDAVAKKEPIVLDTQIGGAGDFVVIREHDAWWLENSCEKCPETCFCRSPFRVNTAGFDWAKASETAGADAPEEDSARSGTPEAAAGQDGVSRAPQQSGEL